MNLKVTGCYDCVFCKWDLSYIEYECIHPDKKELIDFVTADVLNNSCPDWCPLNKEPITIEKV